MTAAAAAAAAAAVLRRTPFSPFLLLGLICANGAKMEIDDGSLSSLENMPLWMGGAVL